MLLFISVARTVGSMLNACTILLLCFLRLQKIVEKIRYQHRLDISKVSRTHEDVDKVLCS